MTQRAEAQPAETQLRPGTLTLTVEESASTLVLRMAGDLDMATTAQVMATLDRLDVDRITQLVLDLHDLDFLDLAGLRSILRANDHCKSHRIRVTLVKPRGFAGRVFTLTGAHRELELVDAPS